MIPARLNVPLVRQRVDGQCVPASAAMILEYMGIAPDYEQLLELLGTTGAGTPSFFVRKLEVLGITVVYKHGTFQELHSHLMNNRPCVAFVATAELPYWESSTNHAVVVVGLDDETIYVNDPAFPDAPIPVPKADFDLAWLERDEYYAAFLRRD